MTSAREHLAHAVSTLTEVEAEHALCLLSPLLNLLEAGAKCPSCGAADLGKLTWESTDVRARCGSCRHTWDPDTHRGEVDRWDEVLQMLRTGKGPVHLHEYPRDDV